MIGIVDYGMGNLRSVQKALSFLGGNAVISAEKETLGRCERLVLPGVGSFSAGMENLRRAGLADYVKRRALDTPLLGICLGMQFLLDGSDEGEGEGLSLIGGRAVRFTQGKIPHTGWNGVRGLRPPLFSGIPEDTPFYFVHSYYADVAEEFTAGKTDYYRTFASAVRAGCVFGVQFHPEKSGEAGLALLENFMRL